jgi:addiction module HigA family antidote
MAAGSRGKRGTDSRTERTSPGAHLRAELSRLGLDQVAVSKATGVSRQSVNNIINGRQPISRAMAGKLGRLTGHSSDYWLSEWFGQHQTPDRAAASPLVNHQIARAVQKGVIAIEPFMTSHLRTASIELTLGGEIVSGGDRIDLARKKVLSLGPGRAVRATTAEIVELPYDYLGRFGAVARLTAGSVILSGELQVEPGFRGPVRFVLFNAGHAAFTLRLGETVGALEILSLSSAAETARPEAVSRRV